MMTTPTPNGLLDSFEITAPDGAGNPLELANYAIDSDTAANGMIVAYAVE